MPSLSWRACGDLVQNQELEQCVTSCGRSPNLACLRQHGTCTTDRVIGLFDGLGDSYAQTLQHRKAADTHLVALELKLADGWLPSKLVTSYASLAQDAVNLFHWQEALRWIQQAQALPLPDSVRSVLYQQEAHIHFCTEDYVSALHVLEHGMKLRQQSGMAIDVPQLLVHHEMLGHVIRNSSKQMPAGVAKAMKLRLLSLVQQLHGKGYENSVQLPKQYVPGLEARPWHRGCNAGGPSWKQACEAIKDALESLKQEYAALKRSEKLHQEGECIHSHQRGWWNRFEINAVSENLDSGEPPCAMDSPAACALFRRLRMMGVAVIRAAGLLAREPHNVNVLVSHSDSDPPCRGKSCVSEVGHHGPNQGCFPSWEFLFHVVRAYR